jgi:alanyl aminopeptidase
LRSAVFALLGRYTDDAQVLAESTKLTEKYLADPASVGRGIARTAMRNLAVHGNASWFERFQKAYLATTDANIRGTIRFAMLFPQAENIKQVLDLSLHEAVSPANVISFLSAASQAREDKETFYHWLEANIAKVTAKMPAYHIARMPEYVSSTCSEHNIKLTKKFYQPRMAKYNGMSRSFDVALDESLQCASLKQTHQGAFSQYLKGISATL